MYKRQVPEGVSDWNYKPDEFQSVIDESVGLGSELHNVEKGDVILMGASKMTILEAIKSKPASVNDYSIIMRWKAGGYSTLFTGDLGPSLGAKLAKKSSMKADFYKAPHHGVTPIASELFADMVNPVVTMVPTSKFLWHHPRSHVLQTWVNKNSDMVNCTNGENGTVRLVFARSQVLIEAERDSERCRSMTLAMTGKEVTDVVFDKDLRLPAALQVLLLDDEG